MNTKYLCVGEEYQKDGVTKVGFKRIGELFNGKNGKTYCKLYHMPGTLIHVYDKEKANNPEDINF